MFELNIKSFLKGIFSFIPFFKFMIRKKTGGSSNARYCYRVWFEHYLLLTSSGMENYPKIVAEYGPGDSLGVGLMSLLLGADKYYAIDLIEYNNNLYNLKILQELKSLLINEESIPGDEEFPDMKPGISCLDLPKSKIVINKKELINRWEKLRLELMNAQDFGENRMIEYFLLSKINMIQKNSVDLILSQAVMEHVMDIKETYENMYNWLKIGGFISHNIDFRAHELHKKWNWHWKANDIIWEIMMRGRHYRINRYPLSYHIKVLEDIGFEILKVYKYYRDDGYKKNQLNQKIISDFNSEDFLVATAHIIARKNR